MHGATKLGVLYLSTIVLNDMSRSLPRSCIKKPKKSDNDLGYAIGIALADEIGQDHGAYAMGPDEGFGREPDVEVGFRTPTDLPLIQASKVEDPQMAIAEPAWSGRKISMISVCLMIFTGIVVGVVVFFTGDFFKEEKEEPIPVYWTKQALRVALEEVLVGSENSTSHPVGTWNVSMVTDFSYLLAALPEDPFEEFNLDISGWQTSQVTNMSGLFSGAKAFNQPLDLWNTSSVKDMTNMFENAVAFDQIIDGWDTSSVVSMKKLFKGATSFNSPLKHWDMSSVTDTSSMFEGASVFNQDIRCWVRVSSAQCLTMFRPWKRHSHLIDFSTEYDVGDVTGVHVPGCTII